MDELFECGDLKEGLFPVLDMISDARVFFFCSDIGKIWVTEACDCNFRKELTKQQLKDLAKEINTIAESITDEEQH